MEDPNPPPQLDAATLLHLIFTPSDFEYVFEPDDFDLLEKIVATDPELQQIVDTVQLHLLEHLSMQNLVPTENMSSQPVIASMCADLWHFDGCADAGDNKTEDMHLSKGSTGSAMKVEQTRGQILKRLSPITPSSSGHYHNIEGSNSIMLRSKDMHLVHRTTGSTHLVQQTADLQKCEGIDSTVFIECLIPSASKKPTHSKASQDQKVTKALQKKTKEMASANEQGPTQSSRNSVCTLRPDQNTDCQILSANEASPPNFSSTISSSTKHKKNDRKRQAVKEVNIPISLSNMHESLPKRVHKPPAYEPGCSTGHPLDNPNKGKKPQRESKKKKKKRKKSKKSYNHNHNRSHHTSEKNESHNLFHKHRIIDEDSEIIYVPPKSVTPLATEVTKTSSPKVIKKPFLSAKIEPIPYKKPKLDSAETMLAINEFMKQRLLNRPATQCKQQTAAYSGKDPILATIDAFKQVLPNKKISTVSSNNHATASLKIPKQSTFNQEFIAQSHEKQHIAAQNKGSTMAFPCRDLIHGRMTQASTPAWSFPSNHNLLGSFRAPIKDGPYHPFFTQCPHEREALKEAFPGQSAFYVRMAPASMPAFPFNIQMQVLSNLPPPTANTGIHN